MKTAVVAVVATLTAKVVRVKAKPTEAKAVA